MPKREYDVIDNLVLERNTYYVFMSPNKYISLNSSGKVHILGNVETKKLLAYLVTFEIISKWSMFVASIPDGAINSFIVFFFNISYSSGLE